MKGAELHDMIVRAAGARGMSLTRFASQFSAHPNKWLEQLASVKAPKAATIEKVIAACTAPIADAA